jgi:hypothetical protein
LAKSIALHFDGPMVAGGLDYSAEEILASPKPATFSTGVEWIDQLTGGIGPGEVWTVMGPAGVGVTTFLRHLSLSAARTGSVVFANSHVPTRRLAQSIVDQRPPGEENPSPTAPQIASWLPLPALGADDWDGACRSADVVILDTWDELWRPHDWARSREERIADARWLREVARSAHTAVVLTARLPRSRQIEPHWSEDVVDDVADVTIELKQEPDSPWRLATVRRRGGGSRRDRIPIA